MRAAIYAFVTALCLTAGLGYARNGETGILIYVDTFEFIDDDLHHQLILMLCREDLEKIAELLEEGYEARIFLKGYGIFDVEVNDKGEFRLYQKNIEIQSRECHPNAPDQC